MIELLSKKGFYVERISYLMHAFTINAFCPNKVLNCKFSKDFFHFIV